MQRRLAAILSLDMVGYSRHVSKNEDGTIERHKAHRETIIDPQLDRYGGRIVKTTGDGFLAEFSSVVDAVDCAMDFQNQLAESGRELSSDQRLEYRVGINLGEIVIDGEDILGDGVNIAARLEAIAPKCGVCISDMVRQNLRGELSAAFQDIGEQSLKNIDRKIRVWQWPVDSALEPAAANADQTGRPTIDVSTLQVLSKDDATQQFAEGISRDLVTALSKIDTLKIRAAVATQNEQASQYHLGGDLRKSGPRIRCNIQLRDNASGHVMWAEQFDGVTEEGFEFEDKVVGEIVPALQIELSDGLQAKQWRREAADTIAYANFLDARKAYKEYSRAGNSRARASYEAALALSPAFFSASVGLARTYIEDASFGWSNDRVESLEKAKSILDRVFAIESGHAGAHAELSHALMVEGEFEKARLEGELSVALDPNNADAHSCLSYILICLERYEDALYSARRALSLNPGTPEFYLIAIAEAHLGLHHDREALAVTDQILAQRPKWISAHVLKILALVGMQRDQDAQAATLKLLNRNPRYSIEHWRKSVFYPDRPDIPALVDRLRSAGLPD